MRARIRERKLLEPPFVVKPILKKIHITMIQTMIHTSSHSRPFSVSAAPRTSAQHKIAQDGNAKAFHRSLVCAPQVALISSGIRHLQTASWSSTAEVRPVVFSPCPPPLPPGSGSPLERSRLPSRAHLPAPRVALARTRYHPPPDRARCRRGRGTAARQAEACRQGRPLPQVRSMACSVTQPCLETEDCIARLTRTCAECFRSTP